MMALRQPDYSAASAHYRSLEIGSRIESADPHALVAMLYEELLLCLNILTMEAAGNGTLLASPHAHRARGIVVSLRAGLDFESGGELAATLGGLYAALAAELEDRLADPDPLRFNELRAGVASLAAAWEAIVA